MRIYLDDEPIQPAISADRSLEEGLREIQAGFCRDEAIIVAVRRDGLQLLGDELAEALLEPISAGECLELTSALPYQLIYSAASEAARLVDEIDEQRNGVADELCTGDPQNALAKLQLNLQKWQQVHTAITQSITLLERVGATFPLDRSELVAALQSPREHLEQIRSALSSTDYVLLADLLQYDFETVLGLWRKLIVVIQSQTAPVTDST